MNGDSQLELVLERYGKILRAAIARTVPAAMALEIDDIEQEARIRVWKALAERRPIQRLESYVYRIGVTAAIDALRKVRARREEQLDDEAESGGGETATPPLSWPDGVRRRREAVETVRGCLERLGVNRRRAVGLRLHGLTHGEISDLTGWSQAKIRNLAYRGLRDLRACCRAAGVEVPDLE